jgi:cell wall-associated NlpC family hydrolase
MDALERDARNAVIAAARTWLGTPYHDGASVKGHGVDCLFLVKCSFEEAGVIPPITVAPYSPQWYLHRSEELYLQGVLEHADEIDQVDAIPGDFVLYRFGRCFSHGAIIIDPGFPNIIHAYKQSKMVVVGEGDNGDLASETRKSISKPRVRKFFRPKSWSRRG